MPDMVYVDSVSIAAVGYDGDSQELHVQFVSGETYAYQNVPPTIFDAFIAAPSKGSYFNREVKPAYQHRKL